MGAVAAVFSKLQVDAPRLVAKMLCAMRHRAQDAAGVAWDERLESEPSPGLLSVSSSTQHTAVGYGFTRILPDDDPQPVRLGDGWLCLDGRIVADRMMVGGAEAARYLQDRLAPVEFTSIQFDIDGAYSICYCKNHELLVTRDSLGLKPLFIASREDLVAVASDRKALYSIGMSDIAGFPPGASLTANQEGSILKRPAKPRARPQAGGVSTNDLLQLLVESVSIHTTGLSSVAVGFSGGLDSAIIAKMAKDAGADVLLTTIGVGRTLEMIQAESAAREIGLPIVVRELSRDDVEQSVDRVLWLIEDPGLMKVSIAVAIYWTARVAAENGRSVILLGQGSDELFG
ncbi:MAG: asparagine synthase-related protein [Candidatus Bathyarchaeia archaeon]